MRGRKPLPDSVKAIKGNPGKQKLAIDRAQAGQPAAIAPAPAVKVHVPEFLTSKRSRLIFGRVIDDYVQQRIARGPDLIAYGRWAYYVDRWIDVKEKLERKPLIYETKSKHGKLIRKHPHFQAMTDLERVLQSLEDRLGLNPVARQNYLRGLSALPRALGDLFGQGEPEKRADEAPADAPMTSPAPASPLGFLQRASADKMN